MTRPIDVERTGGKVPIVQTTYVDEYQWACAGCGHVGTGHTSAEAARASGDAHICQDPLPFDEIAKPVCSTASE